MKQRNKILKEGINEFYSELDYVYIINSIRELKALTKLILDQNQQAILQFHQTKLLDPDHPTFHDSKYSILSKIEIPSEKGSKKSIDDYERKVSEIMRHSENNWQSSNQHISQLSELPLYHDN